MIGTGSDAKGALKISRYLLRHKCLEVEDALATFRVERFTGVLVSHSIESHLLVLPEEAS